jgi:hypothetical protein
LTPSTGSILIISHGDSDMKPHFRLALSFALIFPVFGLSNLFGQPGAFIPPIYLDHFLLLFLFIYCMTGNWSLLSRIAILCFGISIVMNMVIEIWLPENNWIIYLISISLMLICTFIFTLNNDSYQPAYKPYVIIIKSLILLYYFLQTLCFLGIFDYSVWLHLLYIIPIGLAFSLLLITREIQLDKAHETYILLLSLMVYFDTFNYLSINALC